MLNDQSIFRSHNVYYSDPRFLSSLASPMFVTRNNAGEHTVVLPNLFDPNVPLPVPVGPADILQIYELLINRGALSQVHGDTQIAQQQLSSMQQQIGSTQQQQQVVNIGNPQSANQPQNQPLVTQQPGAVGGNLPSTGSNMTAEW